MKKNFSINSAAQKVQVVAAKLENGNLLNIVVKEAKCCEFLVGIVNDTNVQKSLILR